MKKMAALISNALVATGMLAGCGAKQEAALIVPRSVTRHTARTTSRANAHGLLKLRTAATAAHSGLLRPVGMSNSVTMLNARRSLQMTCGSNHAKCILYNTLQ